MIRLRGSCRVDSSIKQQRPTIISNGIKYMELTSTIYTCKKIKKINACILQDIAAEVPECDFRLSTILSVIQRCF